MSHTADPRLIVALDVPTTDQAWSITQAVGDAVSFMFGFAWLLVVSNVIIQTGASLPGWLDATNLLSTAYKGAIEPFMVWDVLKMAFAALSIVGIWKFMPKKG